MSDQEEVIEVAVDPYAIYRSKRGTPRVYVELSEDDYLNTPVPENAKWAIKSCEYDDEGNVISAEVRPLPEFAPHHIKDPETGSVFLLLCAVERPSVRQKRVTVADIEEWDMYLQYCFDITQEDWMTYEEVLSLVPSLDRQTPSLP